MYRIVISDEGLSLNQIADIIQNPEIKIELSEKVIDLVNISRKRIEDIIKSQKAVYGITTGFGRFSDKFIPIDKVNELQLNLIRSHSTGMGEILPYEIVKPAMVLRANSLAKGYSGIRIETLKTLIELINSNIIPFVPSQGSLGASGDLAPLSHIALVLIGEGYVLDGDKKVQSSEILKKFNIKPIKLEGKEGLALINGTPVTLSILLNAYLRAENIFKVADIVSSISLQASLGNPNAFDNRIHQVRPHKGQIEVAENIRKLISDSSLILTHEQGGRIQDAYSFRCIPQVHGASRDAGQFVRGVIETEIASVTDNPLIFEDEVLSGGNFHAQHLGIAGDTLKVAIAEIGNISERRIERMLNPSVTDLPPFLANSPGFDSGFMIAQYTAAAIVSENKAISHPATVDSIPVSGNQEDHCSMAPIAARKALEIADNVEKVLAIELMTAIQSIELRGVENASKSAMAVFDLVRSKVPKLENDRILFEDMEAIKTIIKNGSVVKVVKDTIGKIN